MNKDNDTTIQVEQLYKELIDQINEYKPIGDVTMVEKAYKLARKAHDDQVRQSGEPYIIHPLTVSKILAELRLDIESIVAGILHDVVEDTEYTFDDIATMFNSDVALLVDGVTKLDKIDYEYFSKEEVQAENYRKMFPAMAKDIRVILIKVADRLHNMRTLMHMTREKQKEKARETLDIYAPLADRLGISKIKTELEDLCLRYLDPEAYYDLVDKIHRKQSERQRYVDLIVENIKDKCKEAGIECTVTGRPKHFFSIYKKMLNKNKTLDQIFDLFAVRVLVDSVIDCYSVLSVVHEAYNPMPNRFKDYIAVPKANGYQSLHNTLMGPEGLIFEIQIRTHEMHKTAEYGIAAHWKYKQGNTRIENTSEDEKFSWLRQILEWQKDMSDNHEFVDNIKADLDAFGGNVFCFTPKNDVVELREGSTPVDFAYAIHSAIGNTMVGARVNNRIVTFDHQLKNSDIVEITTSQNSKGPNRDWLKFVKTVQARNKINQWYRAINKEENIQKGENLLEKEAQKKGYRIDELLNEKSKKAVLDRYSFDDWTSILAAIGHGGLKEGQVINKLKEFNDIQLKRNRTAEELLKEQEELITAKIEKNKEIYSKKKSKSGVVVKGIGVMDVIYSKCCSPLPGDEIIGFVTKGRGVTIHRTDCIFIINLSQERRERLIEVSWVNDASEKSSYLVELKVYALNRARLTIDVLEKVDNEGIKVQHASARTTKNDEAVLDLSVYVSDTEQLNELYKNIKKVDGVLDIERANA